MASESHNRNAGKSGFHKRNPHKERYDLEALSAAYAELKPYVKPNKYGDLSIDFFDPKAVLTLNAALLATEYNIRQWSIPSDYLCPPIPGRADLIHRAADLLESDKNIPKGKNIRVLDVGIGANAVYPIIGTHAYGWSFAGVDIDAKAIANVQQILTANPQLEALVELRLQKNASSILRGVVDASEYFDLSVCNPPFFSSAQEAKQANQRKIRNLKKRPVSKAKRNFGGQQGELWYPGGERAFIAKLIAESFDVAQRCFWFTSLVSKEANLPFLKQELKHMRAEEVRVIEMGHGNKKSRLLAWTFLSDKQQRAWKQARWK